MALPDGYTVEGTIDWETPDQYEAGRNLADALVESEFSLLVDEAADQHVLVTEQGDE